MVELPALTSDTIWDILHDVLDDDTVNRLVWQGLGYRYSDPENDTEPAWDTTAVAAEWRDAYPEPPNFREPSGHRQAHPLHPART